MKVFGLIDGSLDPLKRIRIGALDKGDIFLIDTNIFGAFGCYCLVVKDVRSFRRGSKKGQVKSIEANINSCQGCSFSGVDLSREVLLLGRAYEIVSELASILMP